MLPNTTSEKAVQKYQLHYRRRMKQAYLYLLATNCVYGLHFMIFWALKVPEQSGETLKFRIISA